IEQWLKAEAIGDQGAFAALYQEFAPRLYGYLRLQMSHDADIQDLMQDIFVAIWKSAAHYNGSSKAATWIFGIARHKLLDWLRTRHKYAQLERLEEIDESRNGSERDFADLVVTELSIADALATLPPHHAELFYLVFIEAMSYKEISALLGIPEGTVKSRMHQAKVRLRQQLRKGGNRDERTM
ncbi:MAG: RNA polymerase sigma factor, partial [Thermoactinomyces sp.]